MISEPDLFESDWFKTRPENIKEMIRNKPLGKYLMLSTGLDYYVPYSYCEDGTMTVIRFSHISESPMFKVFGIKPDALLPMPIEDDIK